jgi:hypothetical protein
MELSHCLIIAGSVIVLFGVVGVAVQRRRPRDLHLEENVLPKREDHRMAVPALDELPQE